MLMVDFQERLVAKRSETRHEGVSKAAELGAVFHFFSENVGWIVSAKYFADLNCLTPYLLLDPKVLIIPVPQLAKTYSSCDAYGGIRIGVNAQWCMYVEVRAHALHAQGN